MLQAIIDIGSNTLRLVVYKIDGQRCEQVMKKKHLVGLAAFLKNGVMQQEGIERVCEVLSEYKKFLDGFGIKNVAAFTTAALRNAKNSREAVTEIVSRTGIDVRVITGEEEAEYDFIGSTHNLKDDEGLIVDIGGASTEVVYFKERKIVLKTSLIIGSLSLQSNFVEGILPSKDEIKEMRAYARDVVESAEELTEIRHAHICGIGGTFKGGCALYNRHYGEDKKSELLDAQKLAALVDCYALEENLDEDTLIDLFTTCADRLHTIIPGLIIADAVAKRFDAKTIVYSDSGVREGYIYKELIK